MKIKVFTGSSNTAGHDNMYDSTYPVQLQAILGEFWQNVGYVGAAFDARNVALGGAPKTTEHAWVGAVLGTTNTNYWMDPDHLDPNDFEIIDIG